MQDTIGRQAIFSPSFTGTIFESNFLIYLKYILNCLVIILIKILVKELMVTFNKETIMIIEMKTALYRPFLYCLVF